MDSIPPDPNPESGPVGTTDQLPTTTTDVLSPKKRILEPETKGLEEDFEPELPPLNNYRSVDQVVTGLGEGWAGADVQLDADVKTQEGEGDAERKVMGKRKKIVIPDSDAASNGDGEEEVGLSPSKGCGGVVIKEGNGSGEVEGKKERNERKYFFGVIVEGTEGEEKILPGVDREKAEVEGATGRETGASETAYSTEDDGNSIAGTGTKAAPNQDGIGGQKELNGSNKKASQSLPATGEEIDNANALDSTMEVDNIAVISEPRPTNKEDQLSTSMAMAQKALQLSTRNTIPSSDKTKVLESTSEKEDIIMIDENTLPVKVTKASTAHVSDTQPINQQNNSVLPTSAEVAPSQLRVIPDSDEEDEVSSTKTSPVKHHEMISKDINLPNALEITDLPPKRLKPLITNPPSSSPQKGSVTPMQPTNTPTKPKTTTSAHPTPQPPSSPSIPPPVLPKCKNPSALPTTNDNILRVELKAIKLASLQSRNASLIAEISAKKAQLEEVTKGLEGPAEETVKRHIRLLHEYNDMRDVGQGLLGLVADNRGVRVGELYEEFGVGLKD